MSDLMSNVESMLDKIPKGKMRSKSYVLRWCIDNKIDFDVPKGLPTSYVPKDKVPGGWKWVVRNDLTFAIMALDKFAAQKEDDIYLDASDFPSDLVCWQEISWMLEGRKIRKEMYDE